MDYIKTNPLYVGGAVLCVVLATYVYAGLSSPLSHVPGPWYTRYTTLVSTYYVITAHHPKWVHSLHAKYGPIVRFSPHEVDISDPPTCQQIHSIKGGFLKSPFYSLLITNSSNIFNEIRVETHRKYKRLLSNPMSETGLKTFLPRIDNKVRLTVECIREENETRGAADIAKWFMFLSFDIIGDLVFGEGFGQLESGVVSNVWLVLAFRSELMRGSKENQSVNDFSSLGFVGGLRSMFPTISWLSLYLPIPVFRNATKIQYRTFDYAQRALDRHAKRVEEVGEDVKPTVFSKLYTAGAAETWTPIEVRDNAQLFIVGGSDTTANTLIYLIWTVCKIPDVKKRLLEELETLSEDFGYDELKEMLYLNCVIQETLRLYTTLPCGLPRVVPAGGSKLADYFIPEGMTVTTQAYSLHRDENAFPNPYQFYPERWEHITQEMKDCNMAFGRGSRACVGSYLAWIELRLITARFFRNFPNATVSELEGMCDKDMEPALHFLMAPSGHRCLIKLNG
ncbi:benzoate 4-monooxygenase cytochrome [Colletotrichum truncatum]|uniref:Benzoate 4-monooxygenase cytochrome n=1 Tax=Colletotrichum truncatum TaxID=5467 RepID=A0ACC3YGZ5_COLTU|nr:benzoate 4-monooxygenase cytochrome [Colletotrichum truncatum]KAF6784097.1 benzoate 4-monooxygenase cytochrome [Colletotrichum truncatum]